MTSRIVQHPPIGGQFFWGGKLIKQLSDRGIDTENLTIMVLLDALGAAGLSLEQSTDAAKEFLELSTLKFSDLPAHWTSFVKKQEGS